MTELRQVTSQINVLEARNEQLKTIERDYGNNTKKYQEKNLEKLKVLYNRRDELMKTVHLSDPQYMM